ncbi:MAG: hypothetical protein JW910_17110 [Anaerolineae bacterium]|nr:hypothetical protein [Anaerolineae bacterium]
MNPSDRIWQAIDCDAAFTSDGRPQPRTITWRGESLPVHDSGRRWTDGDGLHLLARVEDGRVFELHYNGAAWWGRVISAPPPIA